MLPALHFLIHSVTQLYLYVLIATIVLSWLFAFGVVNRSNQFVDMIWRTCTALTEPVLRPIRGVLPNLGGIDISPIIVFLAIGFLQTLLHNTIFQNLPRA